MRAHVEAVWLGALYSPITLRSSKVALPQILGFTRWPQKDAKKESEAFPPLVPGKVKRDSVKTRVGKTSPPKYFTEDTRLTAMKLPGIPNEEKIESKRLGELKAAMKDKCLGTAATRADHIENLERRRYIERQNKTTLRSTPNGRMLVREIRRRYQAALPPTLTAERETLLKKMESNESSLTRTQFLDTILEEFMRVKEVFIANWTRAVTAGRTINLSTAPRFLELCASSRTDAQSVLGANDSRETWREPAGTRATTYIARYTDQAG